jgi:hypothetical protein
MRAGAAPGRNGESDFNFCCNYMAITKHSRIFKNGSMRHDPKFCDKFEEGEQLQGEYDFCQRTNRRTENGTNDPEHY